MDSRTGEILTEDEMRTNFTPDEIAKFFSRVEEVDMTLFQRENKFVSKHDSRSKLAIARRKAIGKIGRNSPCPCGSGTKFKKCCLK